MAEAQQLLGAVYFVSMLPLEVRHALARRTRSERYGKGERIIHQGAAGETFYLLAQGEVDVHVAGAEQPVAHLARGDHFGEMSLLTGEPRSATVVAASDVVLLVLDRAAFADLLAADPGVARVLCDALEKRRGELEAVQTMQQAAAAAAPMASHRIFDRLREIFKLR